MEQDNAIREELNRQLGMFCRSIAAGLRKPKRRLIHQMIYGIQASRDVKVSEIARSLNETIKLLKTEIRLCRNLQDETLTEHINQKLPREAKKKVVNGYSVLEAVSKINAQVEGKGIYVIDRGGDRKNLIESLILQGLKFVIRLKGDPLMVLGNNQQKIVQDIAALNIEYNHKYKIEIDNEGFKEKKEVEFGTKCVRMPGIKDDLWLVAVRGFGTPPMLLLTNVKKDPLLVLGLKNLIGIIIASFFCSQR